MYAEVHNASNIASHYGVVHVLLLLLLGDGTLLLGEPLSLGGASWWCLLASSLNEHLECDGSNHDPLHLSFMLDISNMHPAPLLRVINATS